MHRKNKTWQFDYKCLCILVPFNLSDIQNMFTVNLGLFEDEIPSKH